MNKEIIIVGAGFSGATIARKLAEENFKVRIIDKRSHIAGNMYDKIDEDTNSLYHVYGPHIFHTDNKEIFDFLSSFSDFEGYNLRTQVLINNRFFSCPFNFETIDTIYSLKDAIELKDLLLKEYPNKKFATVTELLESKNEKILNFATFLWNNDYKLYTAKQWGISPEEVDPNILKRVPIYLNYDNKIHNNIYEGFPINGYTKLFEKMLNHENIEIELNKDALSDIKIINDKIFYKDKESIIVYTGALDELFDYEFGTLNYRSLKFTKEIIKNNTQINRNYPSVDIYPEEKYKFTRITNYGYLLGSNQENQVSMKEYSYTFKENSDLERYYPVNTKEDKNKYLLYKNKSTSIKNLFICGRLADYKYYDMDKAIEAALEMSKKIIKQTKGV